MPVITIPTTDALFQSGYLHLQSCGSNDSQGLGIKEGWHLRWSLNRNLGANHLPKGNYINLFPTSQLFNKLDDFVGIYRTFYADQYKASIDLNKIPDLCTPSNQTLPPFPIWEYNVSVGSITSIIVLKFSNINNEYANALSYGIPESSPLKFIQNYAGRIELSMKDFTSGLPKLFFSAEMELGYLSGPPGNVRLESVSKPDSLANDKIISFRKNYIDPQPLPSDPSGIRIEEENIDHIRFDYSNAYPIIIRIEAYQDFIEGINASGISWDHYGNYALDYDPVNAMAHFDPGFTSPPVDGNWPRYNDVNGAAYTVSGINYADKFGSINDSDSLAEAIRKYFKNSAQAGNYKGNQVVHVIPAGDDKGSMVLSYLDMLRLVALDFHAARMMGLGEIDVRITGPADTMKVLHLAHYVTINSQFLDTAGLPQVVNHIYLTLPTQLADYRMPVAPALDYLSYGMTINNGTGNPVLITDPNGYSLYDQSRYIKLNKGSFLYDIPYSSTNFFQGGQPEFDLGKISRPILFGVEYKENSEVTFRDETLSSDPDYLDGGGKEEVAPIPDQLNPIFIHQETEHGFHDYAIYGINALARTSPLSNVLTTNETIFPKLNHILPPFNFRAQLIQKEDVLILTSQNEQDMLANLPAGDKTLVRVTFDWNHNHNAAYQFADFVELFFQPEQALVVKGKVASVTDLADELAAVYTTSFTITSVNPPETIAPYIDPGKEDKFIGAFFSCDQRQFLIKDILPGNGNDPVFIVKRIKQNSLSEVPVATGQMTTTTTFIKPQNDSMFYVAQNMSKEVSWPSKLAKTVALQVLDTVPYTEPQLEADGTTTDIRIGGIATLATVSEISDPDPLLPNNTPTGIFDVTFTGNPLPLIADPDISFYGGKIRIDEDLAQNPEKKVLEVFDIDTSSANLKLKIYDPSFSYNYPNGPFAGDYVPIKTGSNVQVNFHPSYRVYLKVDSANLFDEIHIMPPPDLETKETFLGARAIDSGSNPLNASVITPPSLIIARTIQEPEPPGEPDGPTFATRPDFYGKSTYTFQTQFVVNANRQPYAMIFYRAMDRSILASIYKQDTLEQVLTDLENLPSPELAYTEERWRDLIRGTYNAQTHLFMQYVTYQFPLPDNNLYIVKGKDGANTVDVYPFANFTDLDSTVLYTANLNTHGTTNLKVIDFVVLAISDTFIPLTEEPILYKFIKESYTTSPKPPRSRDSNGNVITPHPIPNTPDDFWDWDQSENAWVQNSNFAGDGYDPWPMAVKVPNVPPGLVRFTDFTLDGASTKSKFFYFAVEMSNMLGLSAPSVILGPISLINSYPPDPPEVRSVLTRLVDEVQGIPSAVLFSLNNYIESEFIKKIQLYRTTKLSDSKTVRTMTLAGEFEVIDEIKDEFTDLSTPPYGEDIFYRLVAMREIENELSQPGNVVTELIPSQPTTLLKAKVVDTTNPPAPEILPDISPGTQQGHIDVVLLWSPTCYNGKYHLYKMNSSGNWNLLTTISSNDSIDLTFTMLGLLKQEDPTSPEFFHRFKVKVENSSGLFNLTDKELTI